MHVLQQPVLVLSRSYLPVDRVTVKEAVCLIVRGKAEAVEMGDDGTTWAVRSIRTVYHVPTQICLTAAGVERIWRVPPVNRKELFARDNHICQYCGSKRGLTIDHVLPRSRGGQHIWENVITACEPCNTRKGNRTPEEAGLLLKARLKPPMHPAVAFAEQLWAT